MTPLNQRRVAIFRAHRRGWWSLWIFLTLFVITLFAEFVANDRPLVIHFQDRWYFPVLRDYSGKKPAAEAPKAAAATEKTA